jgi:hypothetical protein
LDSFANTAGHTKKTTITALLYVGLTVGNIAGPQLYKANQAPFYQTGLISNLIVLCILFGVVCLQAFYLHILNRRNIARRRASGKTGAHLDFSLESSNKWENLRQRQAEANAAEGHTEATYNENAFADL